ncbi:hypothetical protein AA0112_g2536 [Alternaria arborescens]|uniref:Uncharacterized protein n=1 Tax=Alternaria tenuissima TaxID=119927 RepID=A0A4Q4MKT3_9PLEO|nr:hypothetical protein AA0112_g2536 [Alternaria arborescens]RYN52799.1 hypothetical protein AA0114_g4696 [Alternaria tenuissima]RYO58278.1 hypothetical protein AA0116_g8132 [Alternaria tenuissima]
MLISVPRDVKIVEKDEYKAKARTQEPSAVQTGLRLSPDDKRPAPKTSPL